MRNLSAYQIGGRAGLMLPVKQDGGVSGEDGFSGRGDRANDVSGSVSNRYEENASARAYIHENKTKY